MASYHMRSISFPPRSNPTLSSSTISSMKSKTIQLGWLVLGIIWKFLLMMKEGGQDLQSALRRKSGGESSIEANVKAYIGLRKMVKKDVNKCLDGALKRVIINDKYTSSPLLDQDQHLSVVVGLLREVSPISVTIFQSLFLFISAQTSKPSSSRWSLVSKMMHKGKLYVLILKRMVMRFQVQICLFRQSASKSRAKMARSGG
ncbi:hypothetical protein MKX01_006152 [Papaver californicum]|nr:hypothetical protein MKX01_006152 [Papaver californicum]